jgi:adenylate kinase family enzyme
VKRVSVVGNAGSGKSTVAAVLALRLGVPHVELDSIFWQPGWRELPTDDFRERVEAIAGQPSWVIDGNYGNRVQDLVWARADTVVWIDVPRRVVMRRIIARTVERAMYRRELWSGNRERWQNLFSRDPLRSVMAWAWTQHDAHRKRYEEAAKDPAWKHLRFIRLTSTAEVRRWLNHLDSLG